MVERGMGVGGRRKRRIGKKGEGARGRGGGTSGKGESWKGWRGMQRLARVPPPPHPHPPKINGAQLVIGLNIILGLSAAGGDDDVTFMRIPPTPSRAPNYPHPRACVWVNFATY